jgi:hypothetical protein
LDGLDDGVKWCLAGHIHSICKDPSPSRSRRTLAGLPDFPEGTIRDTEFEYRGVRYAVFYTHDDSFVRKGDWCLYVYELAVWKESVLDGLGFLERLRHWAR